ncbi:MAG: carbohydrate ABC transporter permease [Ruthenibacterium sp.]
MNAKQRHKIRRITSEVLFWLLALVVIVPFLIVLFNAFKTKSEAVTMALTPPTTLHWENFAKVWEDGAILRSYGNSLYISIGSVLLSVMMSAMCAFVLSRNRSRFNKGLYLYFSLGLMFPLSMVTVVKVMRMLHLYGTLTGVVLLFAALLIPLSIFLFYGFVNGIPIELDEAAIVDGAGALRLFFQIILPVMKPVTVTVVMINFLNAWNDFTVPLYLVPDPDKAVVVQQVYNFYGTYTAQWNLVCVTILYAIAPILVVYIIGQKYIISGMVAGAVKG